MVRMVSSSAGEGPGPVISRGFTERRVLRSSKASGIGIPYIFTGCSRYLYPARDSKPMQFIRPLDCTPDENDAQQRGHQRLSLISVKRSQDKCPYYFLVPEYPLEFTCLDAPCRRRKGPIRMRALVGRSTESVSAPSNYRRLCPTASMHGPAHMASIVPRRSGGWSNSA